MAQVRQGRFKISYNGKDITRSMSEYLLSVTYTDKVTGETDEIEVLLEDTDGLWRSSWYPEKGAKLKLSMGYDEQLVDCGEFEIDEIVQSGPPDTIAIKGLAAWVTSAMRTRSSSAHEGKTLKQIAEAIAAKNDLTVTGKIYTIRLERSTQHQETDLAYLKRISEEYGYVFSVRGKQLVFSSVYDLEQGLPVLEIDRSDLMAWSITDKTADTYSDAEVQYRNPKTKEKVSHSYKAQDPQSASYAPYVSPTQQQLVNSYVKRAWQPPLSPDRLALNTRADNKQQAEAKAKAALHKANSRQQEGTLDLEGYPLLVAGNNFLLTGMGRNSGKYHIEKSTHRIDRSGAYTTSLDIKRVGFVEKVKEQPKKKKKPVKTRIVGI